MHTIAAIGVGNRGNGYLRWLKKFCGDRAQAAALCEKDEGKLLAAARRFGVPKERCYTSDEAFFGAGRLAEAVLICTGDRDHYGHAVKAIELGYHVLLEKPISPSLAECNALLELAKSHGVHVVVCHVMRYMPYFQKLYEIATDGRYGRLMGIDHTENVGYFHFAHSYVRGNWRREDETTPMLLAKSCHDFDYINWLMGGGCTGVSSVGQLSYFVPANAPEGAAARCLDCPAHIRARCEYDAERLYITAPLWRVTFLRFMGDVLTGKPKFTKADKYEALRTGLYGRCVYRCDNTVCDHQSTLLTYGDRYATTTTTAFSKRSFRRTVLQLEHADVIADSRSERIVIREFGKGKRSIKVSLVHIVHREGDQRLIRAFVDLLDGVKTPGLALTFIEESIESHRLVLLAEESRKRGGEMLPACMAGEETEKLTK